jgi:hypothetical protein
VERSQTRRSREKIDGRVSEDEKTGKTGQSNIKWEMLQGKSLYG